MDFSSANVPISRETWAPRSPPPPPSGPRGDPFGDRPQAPPAPTSASAREDYGRERSERSERDYPPPPSGPRGGAQNGNGAPQGGYHGNGYAQGGREEPPRRPHHAPAPVDANNVLGVFGLSIRTRERDLEDEFLRYGDVEKVVIVYDQRTDRSRGFGFVTMRTTEDAARAIEKLNGIGLHGRNIRVDYSATQKPHAPTPGEYMGVKRPLNDDRYGGRGAPGGGAGGGRYDDRRGYSDRRGYDDRRGGERYDDRDRDRRDRDYSSRRERDDPYGGRSRREDYDSRRRSPSPRRSRHSVSPDRRATRDYDAPPPAGGAGPETSRY